MVHTHLASPRICVNYQVGGIIAARHSLRLLLQLGKAPRDGRDRRGRPGRLSLMSVRAISRDRRSIKRRAIKTEYCDHSFDSFLRTVGFLPPRRYMLLFSVSINYHQSFGGPLFTKEASCHRSTRLRSTVRSLHLRVPFLGPVTLGHEPQ